VDEVGDELLVPLVPVALVEPAEPVELPLEAELLPWCAFVKIQPEPLLELPPAIVPLVVPEVVPLVVPAVVPDVPAVPLIEPARCKHPVTVTLLLLELLDGVCVLELVCAYTPTAQPATSAIDAPHRFRFMRASFNAVLRCKPATITKPSKSREIPHSAVSPRVAFPSAVFLNRTRHPSPSLVPTCRQAG
jgi:hypothetical protein